MCIVYDNVHLFQDDVIGVIIKTIQAVTDINKLYTQQVVFIIME